MTSNKLPEALFQHLSRNFYCLFFLPLSINAKLLTRAPRACSTRAQRAVYVCHVRVVYDRARLDSLRQVTGRSSLQPETKIWLSQNSLTFNFWHCKANKNRQTHFPVCYKFTFSSSRHYEENPGLIANKQTHNFQHIYDNRHWKKKERLKISGRLLFTLKLIASELPWVKRRTEVWQSHIQCK